MFNMNLASSLGGNLSLSAPCGLLPRSPLPRAAGFRAARGVSARLVASLPCCSIWLANAPPTEFNWLANIAPGLRIWPSKMLNCSVRLGHLLTCSTCGGGEPLAVHHAAAGLEAA